MNYQGKEPCPGCGASAQERPRWKKHSVCQRCAELLKIGAAKDKELSMEYIGIFQHYHNFRTKFVNNLVHDICRVMNNPTAKTVATNLGGWVPRKGPTFGNNGQMYKIPVQIFEGLAKYWIELDEKCLEIERIPETAAAAAEEARTEIFNEGVRRGRNMLIQLVEGGLSMEDFEKRIPYHKL